MLLSPPSYGNRSRHGSVAVGVSPWRNDGRIELPSYPEIIRVHETDLFELGRIPRCHGSGSTWEPHGELLGGPQLELLGDYFVNDSL